MQIDLITLTTLALLGLSALACLAVMLADRERLPVLVRAGMEDVIGDERLRELLALQRAWERKVMTPFQLQSLRALGAALGVLVALVLVLARQPLALAITLGGATLALGWAYPGLRFHRGLARRTVRDAEEYAVGFIVHLRQEAALGVPVEQAITAYITTQRNALAELFADIPAGTGADPIAGVSEIALRTESPVLLPIAATLSSLRDARDAGPVLRSIEERARLMLVARLNAENAKKRLLALLVGVSLMLLSILALVLVPILVNLTSVQL